ncbi:fumarylacetoacetate hydrolase family protein [Cohnella caldifontis]|uniref:fumarylacetoacetate hydrolase family protein n=1 Tax=Cohnella caldifontis TaxID=3027471 RepID=UPI0023EE02F2|nr:fumarylacetoacetate hydrolase family protein [Cohnella sp. YIM B05605]
MKLISLNDHEETKLGIWTEEGVISVADAVKAVGGAGAPNVPQTIMQAIKQGTDGIDALKNLMDRLSAESTKTWLLEEEGLSFEPCVTNPSKIICVGLNYRKHADETHAPYPQTPILFNKFNNALTGHNRDVVVPAVTAKLDYEAELGIVIGKPAKNVSVEEALDYVYGYCAANDLSARDLQLRTNQWMLGKTCDGFCPLGPYLVTADEVGDPNALGIKTTVNGEVRQNSNTSDMIFRCDEIISYVSRHMTLDPGDLILTGTPEGVVFGYPPEQQVYLRPGDVVTVEIEKLGTLRNRFVRDIEPDRPLTP